MNRKILVTALMAVGFSSLAMADNTGRGFYAGVFGGAGRSDNQDVEQTGTAYKHGMYNAGFDDFDVHVDVKGKVQRDTAGLAGAHLGYEWAATSFGVKPAIELEGFYLGADQKSNLSNPNNETFTYADNGNAVDGADTSSTLPGHPSFDTAVAEHYAAGHHNFENKWKMNLMAFMANGVFTYETQSIYKPYVGGGLGFVVIDNTGAHSYQTEPAAGSGPYQGQYEVSTLDNTQIINHFNSKTRATDYAFAAQAKVGLRAEIDKHWSGFAEYRYLWVDSTDFTFGNTNYVGGHSPTSAWTVKNDSMGFHNGLVGLEYAF